MVLTVGKTKQPFPPGPRDKVKSVHRHWCTRHSRAGPPPPQNPRLTHCPGSCSQPAPPRQTPAFVSLGSAHLTCAGGSVSLPLGCKLSRARLWINSSLPLSTSIWAWNPTLIDPAHSSPSFKSQVSLVLLGYLCIFSLLSSINYSIK